MDADVAIIGTGPAGLSAGISAGRAGLSTIMFEKEGIGGELVNRDELQNYPGYPDGIAGPELRSKLVDTVERYDPTALLTEVEGIDPGSPHTIRTADGDYEAGSVIIATGGEERPLDVPGEEEYRGRGVFYCAKCDGPLYQGETIAVVGGSDHALIDAQFLAGLTEQVILIDSNAEFPAGSTYVEAVRGEEAIEILQGTEVLELQGEDGLLESIRVADADGSNARERAVGGLWAHVGIDPNTEFLADTVPLTDEGTVVVDAAMTTEVDGIYAAGDIRTGSPRSVAAAVGDGMVAAESARSYLD